MANGVLPFQEIMGLINSGSIKSKEKIAEKQVGLASFEPTLGDRVYIMPASILPCEGRSIKDRLKEEQYSFRLHKNTPKFLHQGKVHIIPLNESLELEKGFIGESTGRSSVGRTNTVLRLLTENHQRYNFIPDGYKGDLYLEVFPGSFPIKLTKELQLNQIKFAYGNFKNIDEGRLKLLHKKSPLLFDENGKPLDLDNRIEKDSIVMSLKLKGGEGPFIFKARRDIYNNGLDFSRDFSREENRYKLSEFWEIVPSENGRAILTPGEFYIMVTKERIAVPSEYVGKMAAYDINLAELKTQEADLFNPGHGMNTKGFAPVLEIKPLGQPIEVKDGFPICRIIFQKLRENPEKKAYDESGEAYVKQTKANPGRMFI